MKFVSAENNPFATTHLTQIPFRFPTGTRDQHLDRLQTMNYRAAVVGLRGSGKSTLLRELKHILEQEGLAASLVSIPSTRGDHANLIEASLTESRAETILLIDEFERLSFLHRRAILQATKSSSGLIVAAHRVGHLPTWIACQPDISLLHDLLKELKLTQPAIVCAAETAFEQHCGNLHLVLGDLYDQFSQGRFRIDS